MKLETGKFYHLTYPTAPFPYLAKLVAVDIGTDDVILEFLVDEAEVQIKLAQIKSGEVLLEPKKDIQEETRTLEAFKDIQTKRMTTAETLPGWQRKHRESK